MAQAASRGRCRQRHDWGADLTDQDADDPSQMAPLLDQIDGSIGRVMADGAYDGAPTYRTTAAHSDDIEVVIPPRSNGRAQRRTGFAYTA